MSRLKSYIDGKLKFCDIMHPSKLTASSSQNARTRTCITFFMNSHKYELFPNTKLKNWNRRVESKLAAYINGETTAKELVHPSKFPELSEEVMRQKLQKNRMLQSHRVHSQPRKKSTDWIHLGKQFEVEKARFKESSSPLASRNKERNQSEISKDLLPINDHLMPPDALTVGNNEGPKNTVVFNGNVNILCFSMGPQTPSSSDRICDNIKRELQMINTCSALPSNELKPHDESMHLQLCSKAVTDTTETSRSLQKRSETDLHQYKDMASEAEDLHGILQAVTNNVTSSNVNELVAMINDLLPAVQTLRSQYNQVLSDCKELTMERKILLKHQEISDRTINLLNDETKELTEKNQSLSENSQNAIHKLHEEMRELMQKNQELQNKLDELRLSEKELVDVNKTLVRKLQLQNNEQSDLRTLLTSIKQNLHVKLTSLDHCFDAIYGCIEKTKTEVKEIQMNTQLSEKQMLVNTIKKLDEQNSNLMGKVKHMPEKIKNILNHISGTMNSLEEQNIRLLRTLQNSESEKFFESNLLRRLKN